MSAEPTPAPEWLTDANGNRCSVEYFGSVEAAQVALDSLPGGGEPEPYLAGSRVTEYRRGVIVGVDIDPGVPANGVSIKRTSAVPL